jgi:2-hydroxychromene-2-carboxylate isomerase
LFGIWHRRLLHTGEEVVIRMLKSMGLEGKKPESWNCKMCMLMRAYKQILREMPIRLTKAYVELHIDTIPMKPQGLGGFNYCMTIIDAVTMYTWVIFLVQKGDAAQKLHDFIRWLQNQSGKSVKVIMRDGGKEYSPIESKRFAKEFGIDVRESAPKAPE